MLGYIIFALTKHPTMSNKQKYIAVIDGKIAQLQKAKDGIVAIPDNVFDDIFETVFSDLIKEVEKPFSLSKNDTPPVHPIIKDNATSNNDYGKNKRTLIAAIRHHNRPTQKSELVKFFEENGYSNASRVVTNAIVQLQEGGKIIGHKHGLKFKGLLWSLREWWENGELKSEYAKFPETLTEF